MKHWDPEVLERVRSRAHLHVLTDFDGTLVAIAPTPEAAHMTPRAHAALEALTRRPNTTVTVVSGRALEALQRKVGVPGVDFIGNHGMELWMHGERREHPIATAARPDIARLGARIAELAARVQGTVLEQKGISLSLHSRLVTDAAALAALEAEVARLVAEVPSLEMHAGKRVLEIRPHGAPDKGTSSVTLLEEAHGGGWPAKCAPLFLGDDRTDEDGFRALRDDGIGVRVVEEGHERPTLARWVAHGVDDALTLLEKLAAY